MYVNEKEAAIYTTAAIVTRNVFAHHCRVLLIYRRSAMLETTFYGVPVAYRANPFYHAKTCGTRTAHPASVTVVHRTWPGVRIYTTCPATNVCHAPTSTCSASRAASGARTFCPAATRVRLPRCTLYSNCGSSSRRCDIGRRDRRSSRASVTCA